MKLTPQSETPHLIQIAHLDFGPFGNPPAFLSPGTVIWYDIYDDGIIFRVWDYRLNHSIKFSVDVGVEPVEFKYNFEVYYILFKALKLAN